MKTKIIACTVIKEELLDISNHDLIDYEFLSMGLHYHPEHLKSEIQRALDNATDYDRIILGFGLCGQALDGIETGNCEVIIPRIHDCIPLIVGSFNAFKQVNRETPGTYYLSGGWLEGERSVLSEHRRIIDKYGEKRAVKVLKMIFESYRKMVFINTNHPRLDSCRVSASELAASIGLEYSESRGDAAYLRRLIYGPWDEKNFIVLEPGGKVSSFDFVI